jgi:hypothetical protein
MKFYYNDVLVRTSQNHIYTHAVIISGGEFSKKKLIGCRASEETARQIISSQISRYNADIRNYEKAIKALQAGKKYYEGKDGNMTYLHKFRSTDTVEHYTNLIEDTKTTIASVQKYWKVVELEVR